MANPKHHKILIATPAFGFQTFVNYTNSVLKFASAQPPSDLSYEAMFHIHAGSALISHARNDCVKKFLSTDATKLLFIDADIGFDPENIWRLLRKDADIALAPYITKSLKGPQHSKFVLKFPKANPKIEDDGFVEVVSGPTGFMMIDREVFKKLDRECPSANTRMTQIQNGKVVEDLNYPTYFDCITHEKEGALGEDISFCKKWEEIGGVIWADAEAALTHYGTFCFQSQLALSFKGTT
tara:strand:- start:2499 stop:3215 length:717 start_codon:yes stop_codon:yes gene_type:complete